MISWWSYYIVPDRCRRCYRCFGSCLSGAIKKPERGSLWIEKNECTRCGVCVEKCNLRAISRHFSPRIFIKKEQTDKFVSGKNHRKIRKVV